MSRKRKYEKAWDVVKNTWVNPEDVARADMHDRPRYISMKPDEIGNGGVILTLKKATKYTNKKTNKQIERRLHFAEVKDNKENTYENREIIRNREVAHESKIHKLCKKMFENGEIEKIHIDEITYKMPIGTTNKVVTVVEEQYAKVLNVNCIEKKDKLSSKIPDLVVDLELSGCEQRVFIEIFYKHPVDIYKKDAYRQNRLNCLEIDVGSVYEDLTDESEESIKNALKDIIENQAYWVSSLQEQTFIHSVKTLYNDLIVGDGFYRTHIKSGQELRNRVYAKPWELKLTGKPYNNNHSHDIGNCISCNRCVGMVGYNSPNVEEIRVLCRKEDTPQKLTDEQIMTELCNLYMCNTATEITEQSYN